MVKEKPNRMVKGGTKRSIPIEKILEKNSRTVCFTKRRDGLFSKAADLCLVSDSQIAILATPISSHSNVSFCSFGHSSVDDVVAAFLAGKRPVLPLHHPDDVGICMRRKDLGLGFWWEDERLAKSEDPQELRAAINSVSKLLKDLDELRSDHDQSNLVNDHEYLKKKKIENETKKTDGTQELRDQKTLDLVQISDDDYLEEVDQITLDLEQSTCEISDYLVNDDLDHETLDLEQSTCGILDSLVNDEYLKQSELVSHHITQDQTLNLQPACEISDDYLETDMEFPPISDILCNNALPAGNLEGFSNIEIEEMDLDQLIDFDAISECSLLDDDEVPENISSAAIVDDWMASANPYMFSDSEVVVDDAGFVLHNGFDEDDLCFSHVFDTIAAL